MAAFKFNKKWSARPEEVDFNFRVSSAGVLVAPAVGAMVTVAKPGTGVYTLTFPSTAIFAEFLGARAAVESAVAGAFGAVTSWNASTRVLTVTTLTAGAAADLAFSVCAVFSDSVAP